MWSVLALGLLLVTANAHSNKIQNEADMQTALMPQELNPEIVTANDGPWKTLLPILRERRDLADKSSDVFGYQLKKYSRIVACVVLTLSAVVETVLYVLDSYWT